MYYLCIDIGTTAIKCAIVDRNYQIAAEKSSEYRLIKKPDEKVEQDANEWWNVTVKTTRSLLADSGIAGSSIDAVGISSQGISFVPVDREMNPLMNAISWLDTKRAQTQSDYIIESMGNDKIQRITGCGVSSGRNLAKLLWIRQEFYGLFRRIYKILTAHDYILYRLCGKIVSDHTMAGSTQMYDINLRDWSDHILDAFNLDKDMFPQIIGSGSFAGRIEKRAADELGIGYNAVVAAGGQDQKCAVLGSGIDKDSVAVSLGTASAISRRIDRPSILSNMSIPCCVDVLKNKWVMEGAVGTAGAGLKWMRDTIYKGKSYRELDALAERAKTGSLFFYPHMSGASTPVNNKKVRGFLYGINISTSEEEIIRSFMEGVAYQIKSNIDIISETFGETKGIRIYGGGAKSRFWLSVLANITGKRIEVIKSTETACIGAAMLCSMCTGEWKGIEKASESVKIKSVIEPEPKEHEFYQELYFEYISIQNKIMELF